MYYVATREFMEQWDRAKHGELICRMERAIGGLPVTTHRGDAAADGRSRREKVFITQRKMWSYWRKWMYMDTKLEDVSSTPRNILTASPASPATIPFRIQGEPGRNRDRGQTIWLQGVYVHIYGFDIPLDDRKMYPLFAKCAELDIPVSHASGARPGSHAQRRRPSHVPGPARLRFSRT